MQIMEAAKQAKPASIKLSAIFTEQKNQALEAIADALREKANEIIEANEKDLQYSKDNNLAAPLLKRLKFDRAKIEGAIQGILSLIKLPDPIGQTLSAKALDDGLELYKVSCPIGVIGVIFESRPDALVQISCLCLKSGNAVFLKGGSEAQHTNRVLAEIISTASTNAGIPDGWIQLLETRSDVGEMLKMDEYIDLIVPRGSNEFVKYIMDHSNIPVLGHADGICHVYIDALADTRAALDISVDSKTQYVAVCNAAETLLVHEKKAKEFLPLLKEAMDKQKVELRGCDKTREYIDIKAATKEDWSTEYLDYIMSIRTVPNIQVAIDHVNQYGSGHTDSIVTTDKANANLFMNLVDSGNVFWNCSTRFSDGFRYGLGAEVGISTNKIHARGPVGLEGLIIYKWKMKGSGQTLSQYEKSGKVFLHEKLDKGFSLDE